MGSEVIYVRIILAVLYVVQESHYVLPLYFIIIILLLLLLFYSNAILRGH